jgi:cold shock CspA family protein
MAQLLVGGNPHDQILELGIERNEIMRKSGVIKKYFSNRGFGFLGTEGGADLFFHVTDCDVDDEDLIGGRRVEFEVGAGRDGRRIAKGVVLLRGEQRDDAEAWWVSRTSFGGKSRP